MSKSQATVVGASSESALPWDDGRLLVKSVTDYAIYMLDVDGRVASWNAGAEKIKGYRADQVIGTHFSRFFSPEDVAHGKPERSLKLAQEQGRFEDEGWRVRKDGSRFWANVVITALRDESGELRGFGKVTRDLTLKKDADERLRQAEQRFHHLVDAVTDYAIYMLDATGHVATWNAGARQTKGYDAAEIIGKHFSVFYTPEQQKAGKPELVLDTVRRVGRFEEEDWRVRKDGSRFWANVIVTALRETSGAIVGFAKVTRDLTERRAAEAELHRSEERFRLLVENVGDYAIYMLDVAGNVATWNLGAQRMKGYRSDEITGVNFAIFFPPDAVASGQPAQELERARAEGRFEDEGWRVRKDGTRFWANAVVTALRDAHGTLVGFAKITRDLTLRRQAEQNERTRLQEQTAREVAEAAERQLRASEERYRALSKRLEVILEGVGDGISVQDRSGRVIFCNSAAARACGFDSVDQMLGTPTAEVAARFQILDEDGAPCALEALPSSRVLRGERPAPTILRIREKASRREWLSLIRSTAVLGADGQPELAINIWHDVTVERRQEQHAKLLAAATAALARSLDWTDTVSTLANSLVPEMGDWCAIHLLAAGDLRSVAVAHVDPAKVAAAREYQEKYPPNPGQTRGVWQVIRSGNAEVYNDITDDLLQRSAQSVEHLAALRAVGMKAVLIVPIPVRQRIVGAISLISAESESHYDSSAVAFAEELGRRMGIAVENTELYNEAQDAAKRAERASRIKDEFLATVSHELRTPLNAILGWSALLKGRLSDPDLAKPIEVIHRNAQAQVKIIDDILDVSRVITGKFQVEPKPADLVVIAQDALEVVRPSALAKRISLDFASTPDFCPLVIDPERIQQVIWNLLSNAVKFTDAGGKVQVSVSHEGSDVKLTVSDTGRGIEPDFLGFVFDRFRQADSSTTRRSGGLGLGLALVRHIVELHGGSATVASDGLGKGSTFTITLPVRAVVPDVPHEEVFAPRVASSAPPRLANLNGVRVLVVDDEIDARELIAAVLTAAGATVATGASASEGFEILKRTRPDVLVSDIGMPLEDGLSFIRRVRELPAAAGGRIPAVALTAYARERDRTQAISAGFTTHIGKPVNPDTLVSAVANLSAITRQH